MSAWIDAMKRVKVLDVAGALGLPATPARGASGGSVYGCPACGAERRHAGRHDRRGALGVRHDGTGWRCMDCDCSGDVIDLVAFVLRGKRYRELSDAGRSEVREWCTQYTGVEISTDAPARQVAPSPPPATAPSANPPPESEVRTFWGACGCVESDSEVRAYLDGRRIDARRVNDSELARVLPVSGLPTWARPWVTSGHRLIVPLYDDRGLMRSVLARSIDAGAQRKSLAPSGYGRARLLMSCPFGRWLLATGQWPEWWARSRELRVVVAEGETDFLFCAGQWSDAAEYAPATLGIMSGSWTPELAARLPDGATVVVATDHDVAGERYAALIARSFEGRAVQVERWEARA